MATSYKQPWHRVLLRCGFAPNIGNGFVLSTNCYSGSYVNLSNNNIVTGRCVYVNDVEGKRMKEVFIMHHTINRLTQNNRCQIFCLSVCVLVRLSQNWLNRFKCSLDIYCFVHPVSTGRKINKYFKFKDSLR